MVWLAGTYAPMRAQQFDLARARAMLDANLHGVLSCYDRIIITGTLPGACYAGGMTSFLYSRGIRIFDYPKFAEPFRNTLRENAERLAADNGIEIEFLRKGTTIAEAMFAAQIREARPGETSAPGISTRAAPHVTLSCGPWEPRR